MKATENLGGGELGGILGFINESLGGTHCAEH